jgi:hypothetical protein
MRMMRNPLRRRSSRTSLKIQKLLVIIKGSREYEVSFNRIQMRTCKRNMQTILNSARQPWKTVKRPSKNLVKLKRKMSKSQSTTRTLISLTTLPTQHLKRIQIIVEAEEEGVDIEVEEEAIEEETSEKMVVASENTITQGVDTVEAEVATTTTVALEMLIIREKATNEEDVVATRIGKTMVASNEEDVVDTRIEKMVKASDEEDVVVTRIEKTTVASKEEDVVVTRIKKTMVVSNEEDVVVTRKEKTVVVLENITTLEEVTGVVEVATKSQKIPTLTVTSTITSTRNQSTLTLLLTQTIIFIARERMRKMRRNKRSLIQMTHTMLSSTGK